MPVNGNVPGFDLTSEAPCDEDELLDAVTAERHTPASAEVEDEFFKLSPIYFIGDSRTIVFRNSTYVSPFTSTAFQLRSVYLRDLYVSDFYGAQDGLSPLVLATLAADQASITYDEGRTWIASRRDYEANADGRTIERGPAPLVLFCGANERRRLLDDLGPDADVAAWDEPSRRCDLSREPASMLVSADDALQRAVEILEPFARGIDALRAMGFERIFVHGYARPPIEGLGRGAVREKSIRQRHPNAMRKAALLIDAALRITAQRTSARYIPPPGNGEGVVPPEFTWDGFHYNARGACEVARAVVSVLEGVVE